MGSQIFGVYFTNYTTELRVDLVILQSLVQTILVLCTSYNKVFFWRDRGRFPVLFEALFV